VLDDASRALLEAGSSTIVGLVDSAGDPFATRGWGSVVIDGDPIRLRVLVGAGAFAAAGYHLGTDVRFAVAVTGAEVRTLVSVQVKGTAISLELPTEEDLRRSVAFCDDFFGAVEDTDNVPPALMQRLVPSDLWACTVEVAEAYDQTPGPGAGGRLT
jgi:hypothetical protein